MKLLFVAVFFASSAISQTCPSGQVPGCVLAPVVPPTTECSSATTSTTFRNGVILHRQCAGKVYWGPYRPTYPANTAWQTLDAMFQGTWATSYALNNAPFAPYLTPGQFMSLAFTPTPGSVYSLVINYMGSYGTNGVVTYSRTPGDFAPSDSSCIAYGSNNLLGYSAAHPGYCTLPSGRLSLLRELGLCGC